MALPGWDRWRNKEEEKDRGEGRGEEKEEQEIICWEGEDGGQGRGWRGKDGVKRKVDKEVEVIQTLWTLSKPQISSRQVHEYACYILMATLYDIW